MKVAFEKKLKNFDLEVNFEIPDSGITVLFGPSGSGKSSILNLIAGLDNETKNLSTAFFSMKNKVYDDLNNDIKIKSWQRNIGYVFQEHRLFPNMKVKENIYFGYKRRKSQLDIKKVIEKFRIKPLLDQFPEQLSGGEKQRVAMVRALLSNPDILILDEPLAALDYQSRQELLPYIECIHKELTIPVIYVSHDIKEVLRLADYMVILDQGKVVDKGSLSDLCIYQPLLTQAEGSSFILHGKVSQVFVEDSLVEIDTGNEKILITDEDMQIEQEVRILIHAREVSLCRTRPEDSSILNCVPVVIDKIEDDKKGKQRVMATMDAQKIVAMISYRSARQLRLVEGSEVYAQFKATGMIK